MKIKKNLVVLVAAGLVFSMGGMNMTMAAENPNGIEFYGAKDLREVAPQDIKSPNANPFGLVYEGAIAENKAGAVNIHPVTYRLNGNLIAANIYTPAGYDAAASTKYPAIVVAHPNGGVKEQVAGLYAQRLAESGFITIAADASFQGASGGLPRNLDNPLFRVEDIHGMADIIASYPGVDGERIGALGICGGGGYTIKATESDKRLRAVATLSMFNSGIVRKDGFLGSAKDTTIERLTESGRQRAREAAGADIARTPATEKAEISAADLAKMTSLYSEGYIYYGKTHAHPNSTFQYTVRSNMDLFIFDSAASAELINQPLLMIAGSEADTLYMTEDVYKKATGTQDKELYLVQGATHIRTYYEPQFVQEISGKLATFFKAKL